MFGRGSEAFENEMNTNHTIYPVKKFFFIKADQNQIERHPAAPVNLLHLNSVEEAVIVPVHDLKFITGKYMTALCFGTNCPYCARGIFKKTVAIHKIYNTRRYLNRRSNEMVDVGVQPLLATKGLQLQLQSLASAMPQRLKGIMLLHTEEKPKSWTVTVAQQQPNAQAVSGLQQSMGGYTDVEIMKMLSISTPEVAESTMNLIVDDKGGRNNNNNSTQNFGGFNNNQNNNNNNQNNGQNNNVFNSGNNNQNNNANTFQNNNFNGGQNNDMGSNNNANNNTNGGLNNQDTNKNNDQNNNNNNNQNNGGQNNNQTNMGGMSYDNTNQNNQQGMNVGENNNANGGSQANTDPDLGQNNNQNNFSNDRTFTADEIPF